MIQTKSWSFDTIFSLNQSHAAGLYNMLEPASTARLSSSSSDLYILYYPLLLLYTHHQLSIQETTSLSIKQQLHILRYSIPRSQTSCAGCLSSHITVNGAVTPIIQVTAPSSVPQLQSPVRNGENAALKMRILRCLLCMAIAVILTARRRNKTHMKERPGDYVPWKRLPLDHSLIQW